MKLDAWFPFYIGDYTADTLHLTFEEHGRYLILMCAYWRKGGPLTQDEVAGLMRLDASRIADALPTHMRRIASFFRIKDGLWHHKRIDAELERVAKLRSSRESAAKSAACARWGDPDHREDPESPDASRNASRMRHASPTHASGMDSHSHSHSHSKGDSPPYTPEGGVGGVELGEAEVPPPEKPKKPPEEPIKELPRHLRTQRMVLKWAQWQTHRRAMKKPKSWLMLFNEQLDWLSKFSEPKAFEILSQSIRNGWQGLFEPKGTNENRSANNGRVDRNAGTCNEGKAHLYAVFDK